MKGQIDIIQVAAQLIVIFFAIGIHEYAHCKFADLAGDPTPGIYGRVTLNLTKHFEPTGTILILLTTLSGFGIGWGKPAPMDPKRMHNPRWDFFMAVIAGPISNVLQAVLWATLFRLLLPSMAPHIGEQDGADFLFLLTSFGVLTNLSLALFNMIPFGPLDGHWLLGLLLPEQIRLRWFRFNRKVGMPGLIVAVLFLQFANISLLSGPVLQGFQLLTGHSYFEFYRVH